MLISILRRLKRAVGDLNFGEVLKEGFILQGGKSR